MARARRARAARSSLHVCPLLSRIHPRCSLQVGLAESLNPNIGFWDPLGLAKRDFWDQGNEATIGFLRHAEIKHGRVAMAGFVGYCVQANGIYWPWPLANPGQEDEITHAMISAAGSPPEQWDALPTSAKVQIILFLAIIEYCGEQGKPHYMRGGKPGAFPKLTENKGIPHPVPLNLYDPFGWSANMDEATKERRLLMEINNGRLAMLGIFSFMSASKGLIVPGLDFIPPYAGEYMGYFSASDGSLPFVTDMVEGWAKLAIWNQ